MRILALDLGKYKSVSCAFETERQTTEYGTLRTDRPYLTAVLRKYGPDLVSSELAELERKLTALAEQDERIGLLQTIPGVGRVTAEIIATHLDRPERFTNARQVSSYAGLVPRQYQSGLMDRQGGITRRGSRLLRSALVECAWAMLRYNPWAREHYLRLVRGQKNRKKKAIIAVARKLLVRCWAMLRDHRAWSASAPAVA